MESLGASPLELVGGALLFCAIVGLLVTGWKQATEADIRAAENDLDVARRVRAERERLKKLRDVMERGA